MSERAQSSGHEWPVIHEELVRACIHAALPDSLLPQLRDAELSIMATRIAARINAEIYKQVASVAQPKSSGHEWVSSNFSIQYGRCSCQTTDSKWISPTQWQVHVASVAQAAPTEEVGKPAQPERRKGHSPLRGRPLDENGTIEWQPAQPQEVPAEQRDAKDGLEAQLRELCYAAVKRRMHEKGEKFLDCIMAEFAAFVRTHQAARESQHEWISTDHVRLRGENMKLEERERELRAAKESYDERSSAE